MSGERITAATRLLHGAAGSSRRNMSEIYTVSVRTARNHISV